jgi:hypothetical protein
MRGDKGARKGAVFTKSSYQGQTFALFMPYDVNVPNLHKISPISPSPLQHTQQRTLMVNQGSLLCQTGKSRKTAKKEIDKPNFMGYDNEQSSKRR